MKRYIFIGLCALCMGLMAGKGNAQEDNQDPIEIRGPRTGFTFLRFPTNARLEALGKAGVGLTGSGQAILYNPAGLAFMEGREVHFTYVDWISGIKHYVAGISAHVPRIGTFGLSVVNQDTGPGWSGNTTEKISQYAISGAYGVMITNWISVGTTLKLIHEDFPSYPAQNVFAFDLGAYFATGFRNTVLAMNVENMSAGIFGEPEQGGLPKNIRLGVLLDLIALMNFDLLSHTFDLVVDVNNPNDSESGIYIDGGIEYMYMYHAASYSLGVVLRRGYRSRPYSTIDSNTFGIGVQFQTAGGRGVTVDYARRSFNFFLFADDPVHILSVAFDF